jgi:hypothetical protein
VTTIDDCEKDEGNFAGFHTDCESGPQATCEAKHDVNEVDEECQATVTFNSRITACCVDLDSIVINVTTLDDNVDVEFDPEEDCEITHDEGLSVVDIECHVHASNLAACPAHVQFEVRAKDCCGVWISEPCTASAQVVDEIPPQIIHCPEPITVARGDRTCNGVEDWLNSFEVEDNCPGEVTTGHDGSECGFPPGKHTVTFTATDACGNESECETTIEVLDSPRLAFDKKGSLLVFSKVEILWDGQGNLIQDTFLDITNDYPGHVTLQAYLINGDIELQEILDDQGGIIQNFEPGWNTADCRFDLTANQPHYWSAANGSNRCQAFTVLDEDGPGRPSEANDGTRILRGYVVVWAVRHDELSNLWHEIRWNHLKGDAVIIVNINKGR